VLAVLISEGGGAPRGKQVPFGRLRAALTGLGARFGMQRIIEGAVLSRGFDGVVFRLIN
jgi:hypothetical protein